MQKNKQNKHNVLIIGAGKVSAFYDSPGDEAYLTHAHAFSDSENFNLLGFFDVNAKQSQRAASKWGVRSFSEKEYFQLIDNGMVDVCCLCTPEAFRFDYLKDLSTKTIKLLFCEKPLISDFVQANRVLELYQHTDTEILMNYSRRFVPEFREFRDLYNSGRLGKFLTGNGYYGKGFLHNGSHHYDFLRFILGEIEDFSVYNQKNDLSSDDLSYSVVFYFKEIPEATFTLNACDENKFTIFEMDFMFERCRVRISEIGTKIEYFYVNDSDVFANYRFLELQQVKKTQYLQYMKFAVENAYRYLEFGESLGCSLKDGYEVMRIWNAVKEG